MKLFILAFILFASPVLADGGYEEDGGWGGLLVIAVLLCLFFFFVWVMGKKGGDRID